MGKKQGGRKPAKAEMETVGHAPTLRTVIMVEETLQQAKELISVAELKRRLPHKVMHQTLLTILDYLQLSGKILISAKGVLWIYSPPEELARLKKGGSLVSMDPGVKL